MEYPFFEFKLVVKQSTILGAGMGLFAGEDIPEKHIIGEYEGKRFTSSKIFSLAKDIYVFGTDNAQIYPYQDCVLKYINDNVDFLSTLEKGTKVTRKDIEHNVSWEIEEDPDEIDPLQKERVYVMSIRDIEEGEELFIDYSKSYWSGFAERANAGKKIFLPKEKVLRHKRDAKHTLN